MKKLITILLFTFLLSIPVYSQSYTTEFNGDTIKASDIYNLIKGTSYSSMASACQSYTIVVKGSDSIKVSFDEDLENYFYTTTSPPWNYIGEFRAGYQRDIWFYATTGIEISVSFIKLIP